MNDGRKKRNSEAEAEEPQDLNEYSFIKETIKEKPVNKKAIMHRIAATAAGAVLFGVISALVFAGVYPFVSEKMQENQEPPKVKIDVDEPNETEEEDQQQSDDAAPEVIQVPRSITLEDYTRIYEEVHQIASQPLKAMVTVTGVTKGEDLLDNSYVSYGQAAGVIIAQNSEQVYVLTGKSALGKNAEEVQVFFCDSRIAEGKLRKIDDGTDLAVVSVPVKNISKSTLKEIEVAALGNSYSLMQGKPVIAIGSPSGYNEAVAYGNIISVSNKVTVVDAEYNLLVTDILGSQEGSGVLLDTGGSVIGVITQSFGDPSDNVVKALPVSQLKSLLASLSNGEDIRYAGIYGQDVTESIAEKAGIPQGIYVDSVATESPAMIAGIQSADVITEFNGKEVMTMQKFSTELQKCDSEQKVPIKLMRKGSDGYVEMEFEITIGIS